MEKSYKNFPIPKKILLSLIAIIGISIFMHFFKIGQVPPCLNADEVSHGYNAYSILKTGKDEHGKFMPLRFQAFGEYKLPLYAYLSIPSIALLGATDFSIRLLNIIVGILFVPTVFFLTRRLFKNDWIALLAAFLVSVNPGLYIATRHAHEVVLCAFFILLSLFFLLQYQEKNKWLYFWLTNISIFLATFAYHTGKLFLGFIVVYQLFYLFRKKHPHTKSNLISKILILAVIGITPLLVDYFSGANRVQQLLFINNPGFQLRINQEIGEHPSRIVHNKATEAVKELTQRYVTQFSTDFLLINGDSDWRFGMKGMGLITVVEYLFFFIGLFYLFKNNNPDRFLLVSLFLLAPLGNAFTWQEPSLTRTYFILFPILIIAAYGFYSALYEVKTLIIRRVLFAGIALVFGFYLFTNLDLYFNHYPQRAMAIRAWQCGYKELAQYVQDNYSKYDKFVITKENGQPYIYLLYYLQFDPTKFHNTEVTSGPDQYGFNQVEKFDKFDFNFHYDPTAKKIAYIGVPADFNTVNVDKSKIKKITKGTEEMFWIFDND